MNLIEEVRYRQGRTLPPPAERRAIRIAAQVTQVRMAEELGVTRVTLVRWENDVYPVPPTQAARYAELLAALKEATA